MNIKPIVANLIATAVFWLSAVMMALLVGSDSTITDLAAIGALAGSLSVWIVWALSQLDNSNKETESSAAAEKAKRGSGEDARLALLLQLMGEDERQALRRRLTEDLQQDGEAVALADLLAEQDQRLAARK